MTLLASERSLLIRNKFRSVLQLRIQNRRQSEINADSGLKTAASQKPEKDQGEALHRADDATQKLPPSGQNIDTAPDSRVSGAQRKKKTRQAQDLGERIQHPPADQQHKHTLPLENCPASFQLSSDVFEDDMSSSSSSSPNERHCVHQSPAFSLLPGLSGDQLLREFSAAGQPFSHSPAQSGLPLLPATEGIRQPMCVATGESNAMVTSGRPNGIFLTSPATPLLPKTARPSTPTCSPSLSTPLTFNQLPHPRKTRETKPKMKKLKYHQYIPPDQRGVSGNGVGGAKQKGPTTVQPLDNLLKQQQVFLQLQILQSQQQQHQQQCTLVSSGDCNDLGKSSGAMSLNPHPDGATTNHTPADTNPMSKPELLPANLDDLTVSELRQQLRKRGLPVSGTKPTLLERLQPFQIPQACLAPAPLCQLGNSINPLNPCHPIAANRSPSSGSGPDSPSSSPNQQIYIQDQSVPLGIPGETRNGIPIGFSNVVPVSLAGEQCGLTNTVYIAPASTASGTPSPTLPMSSSSPFHAGNLWRTDNDQQHQQQQHELSVELEMRERIRTRPRDRAANNNESCGGSLHPFLQQDPGCSNGKTETDPSREVLFTQVFCSQPCHVIDQNFELPVQITASPDQTAPTVRSLEEELQEAIQKAQMDPMQSIDDILDSTELYSTDCTNMSDPKSPNHQPVVPASSPLPDRSQTSPEVTKDDIPMPSPLCSSLLLELPPSPAVIAPSQTMPAPPPPRICSSPLSSAARKSRKRRAPSTFDAADWLETLTSGFRPLTPPTAPFVETDFSLDSDLNVNRVLDLMIEQW
ncbi:myocardin [Synchiropus splendidus]|uniref:myocardin n=1 Tax=Synchiropus splendidus TaxID=270530 RepID=UPI00237E7B54|nr:myocardin [Synchiropus splendidus]XP_053744283.1 myocardin [Synchiropus splendidus]XP_053744284.1 myocardin [Synchiropus splendidus]